MTYTTPVVGSSKKMNNVNKDLPLEKKFLSSSFNMNDFGETSLVLGIKIHRDRRKNGIRTIANAYVEKILKK